MRLAQYGEDKLVSRSQTKRLPSRVELFKTVTLNFDGMESIGQDFAGEIFRVFAAAHPEIGLLPCGENEEVRKMVARVGMDRTLAQVTIRRIN